jgi:starch synthase (maltosyl-transferring)
VVVTLDSEHPQEGMVYLDMPALGYEWTDQFIAHDEVTGATYEWGQANYVRLDPIQAVAHILAVAK